MIKKLVEKLFWKIFEFSPSKSFDVVDVDAVFVGLAKDEYLVEYLKYLITADKERYFKASNDMERFYVKGNIARTEFLVRQLYKYRKRSLVKKKSPKTKVGGRYGI